MLTEQSYQLLLQLQFHYLLASTSLTLAAKNAHGNGPNRTGASQHVPRAGAGATKKCPESVLAKILGAHERRYYFALWLHHGQQWGDVMLFESNSREARTGSHLTHAWMTEGEMQKVWSPEVVYGLIEACSAGSSARPAEKVQRDGL